MSENQNNNSEEIKVNTIDKIKAVLTAKTNVASWVLILLFACIALLIINKPTAVANNTEYGLVCDMSTIRKEVRASTWFGFKSNIQVCDVK